MRKIYKYVRIYLFSYFHWLMTSRWRNMSDIFYILSIPEILNYHVDTLVTGYCVPWLHVKQSIQRPKLSWHYQVYLDLFYHFIRFQAKIQFWKVIHLYFWAELGTRMQNVRLNIHTHANFYKGKYFGGKVLFYLISFYLILLLSKTINLFNTQHSFLSNHAW